MSLSSNPVFPAVAYSSCGNLAFSAVTYNSCVVQSRTNTLGKNDPRTLASMANLGRLQLRLGKINVAESALCEVLKLRKRTLGERHPDTLVSMAHLNELYQHTENNDKAKPLMKAEVNLRRQLVSHRCRSALFQPTAASRVRVSNTLCHHCQVGEDDPSFLDCLSELGLLHSRMDELDEAEGIPTSLYVFTGHDRCFSWACEMCTF